jgi:enolase
MMKHVGIFYILTENCQHHLNIPRINMIAGIADHGKTLYHGKYMIRPEHPFDIRPDLRKAASTKSESTKAASVIRPNQLVRSIAFYFAPD